MDIRRIFPFFLFLDTLSWTERYVALKPCVLVPVAVLSFVHRCYAGIIYCHDVNGAPPFVRLWLDRKAPIGRINHAIHTVVCIDKGQRNY